MESMYQAYRDIAEFRLVYITEAHAADGARPVGYAEEKGITEHDDYGERCTTADMLLNDERLTIPFVIDGMDNKVGSAYKAHPDRVFLVRTDGRLAVAAARGPRGFAPALQSVERWLKEYRATGEEPALAAVAQAAGEEVHLHGSLESLVEHELEWAAGRWRMSIVLSGCPFDAELELTRDDAGSFAGRWMAGEGLTCSEIVVTGRTLSFSFGGEAGGVSRFEGEVDDGVDGEERTVIRGVIHMHQGGGLREPSQIAVEGRRIDVEVNDGASGS